MNKTILAKYVRELKQKDNMIQTINHLIPMYHLIPISQKVPCYARTQSLTFSPTQTKMSY